MSTVYLDQSAMKCLNRIADALDRAFPKPESDGKLKVGVASYKYDDPQTRELRKLQDDRTQDPTTDGSAHPI